MPLSTTSTSIGQKIWIGIRFVLFGFFGFLLMLFAAGSFMSAAFGHHLEFLSSVLSLPLTAVGALMMLYGAGQWRRWAYLWVFLSVPMSICLVFLIRHKGSDGEGGALVPAIVAAAMAFISLGAVRDYYASKPRAERREEP